MVEKRILKPEEYSESRKQGEVEKMENKVKKKEVKQVEVKAKKEKSSTPSFVTCNKCKKDYKVRKDIYLARVEKFGSIKVLEEKYLCRECRPKKEKQVKEKKK
jgi:hypothetical protein